MWFPEVLLSQGAFIEYNERFEVSVHCRLYGSGGAAEGFVGGNLLF